jgi:hypothetical protein
MKDVLVLKRDCPLEKAEQQLEELRSTIFLSCSLTLEFGGKTEHDQTLVQLWWHERNQRHVTLSLIDDSELNARWIEWVDTNDSSRQCVIGLLIRNLSVLTKEELTAALDMGDLPTGAMFSLALVIDSDEKSQSALAAAVIRSLRNGDAVARREAALAAVTGRLSGLRAQFSAAMQSETMPEVRRALEYACANLM